jgi:hypothetical protein
MNHEVKRSIYNFKYINYIPDMFYAMASSQVYIQVIMSVKHGLLL